MKGRGVLLDLTVRAKQFSPRVIRMFPALPMRAEALQPSPFASLVKLFTNSACQPFFADVLSRSLSGNGGSWRPHAPPAIFVPPSPVDD
jgi:hypothetical protein